MLEDIIMKYSFLLQLDAKVVVINSKSLKRGFVHLKVENWKGFLAFLAFTKSLKVYSCDVPVTRTF